MACLDTCALIDLADQGTHDAFLAISDRIRQLQAAGETLVTTRLTVAEIWVGIERSRDREKEMEAAKAALRHLQILEFDALAAEVFGQMKAHLLNRGQPRGDMDTLIAAVAKANGHAVVTRNNRHFEGIPGLAVLTY